MSTPIRLPKENLKLKILIKGVVMCTLPTGEHVFVLCAQSLSHVHLFATPWTVAHQAPLSMEFSRQEYWSGLRFPSPGDLPNPGMSPALAGGFFTTARPGKPRVSVELCFTLRFTIKNWWQVPKGTEQTRPVEGKN